MVEGIRISRGSTWRILFGGPHELVNPGPFLPHPENWDCTKMIRFLMAYLEDHLSGCK